jgi:hypothetical protein
MALKKCKECGAEVSSSAKKCPKCGKKLKGGILGKIIIVIIVLGVIGGIASNMSGSGSSDSPEEVGIGDTITTEKLEITITRVSQRNSVGTGFLKSEASQDSKYLVVEWDFKNISNKALNMVWDIPELTLINSKDVEYEEDTSASSGYANEKDIDQRAWDKINPDITANRASVFEVPIEALEQEGWRLKTDMSKTLIIID